MKTIYKYIYFVKVELKNVPLSYACRTNKTDAELGGVFYYKRWKCWAFVANAEAVWSADCLRDVQDFLEQLK